MRKLAEANNSGVLRKGAVNKLGDLKKSGMGCVANKINSYPFGLCFFFLFGFLFILEHSRVFLLFIYIYIY